MFLCEWVSESVCFSVTQKCPPKNAFFIRTYKLFIYKQKLALPLKILRSSTSENIMKLYLRKYFDSLPLNFFFNFFLLFFPNFFFQMSQMNTVAAFWRSLTSLLFFVNFGFLLKSKVFYREPKFKDENLGLSVKTLVFLRFSHSMCKMLSFHACFPFMTVNELHCFIDFFCSGTTTTRGGVHFLGHEQIITTHTNI